MRILMWFTIGFAMSCAACVYLFPQSWLLPAVCIGGVLLFGCLFFMKKHRVIKILFILLLGILCGLLRYGSFRFSYIGNAQALDRQVLDTEMTALEYSYENTYGFAVEAETRLEGRRYNVRVYLREDPLLQPGDEFSGTFRFRYTAPKEGERTSYLQSRGIFLVADQRSEVLVSGAGDDLWRYYPAKLAKGIDGVLNEAFPADVYPFVKAVLLGDTSELSYETDTALKVSGIRHIVAVSGLHVSILYGLLRTLTAKRRFLTALIGFPALLLFAAVAGFTPSVTRACIMTGLMMLSELVKKEYDGPTALSFSCLVMLAADPVSVCSVSLQLSAGCVAGIMLFQQRVKEWIDKKIRNVEKKDKRRVKSWFSSSVAVTLSAMSLTTPLCAAYFGMVSIIGLLTNLLTLWVMNAVFIGTVIVCAVGALYMPAASLLGWVVAWPVRYVLAVASLLSKLPFAAVYTASGYIILWLVFAYGLLILLFFGKSRNPGAVAAGIAMSLVLAMGCSWLEPLLFDCTVTVLDVGQGQSIIVQTEGKTILVDCGGSSPTAASDAAAEKLLSMGIGKLDAVLITHGDADHYAGLSYLLTRVEADVILLPGADRHLVLPDTEAKILWAEELTRLSFGDTSVTVYPPAYIAENNENSLCILFDTEKYDILITGDRSDLGERMLIGQYAIPQVDLLVAGHHGSKYSTGTALLAAVQPDAAVISVGKDNIYGHPAQDVLDRLREAGCSVFRTDEDGTVIFRR